MACVGVCKCHSPWMEARVNLQNSVFSFYHMGFKYSTWVIRLVLYISASVFFLKDPNYLCLVSSFLISLDKCLFIQLVLSSHSFWVKHLSLEVSRALAILFSYLFQILYLISLFSCIWFFRMENDSLVFEIFILICFFFTLNAYLNCLPTVLRFNFCLFLTDS